MNEFDRRLEIGLAQMLDGVVRAPAPPRRRPQGRPALHLLSSGAVTVPPPAPVVPAEAEVRLDLALAEVPVVAVPALI